MSVLAQIVQAAQAYDRFVEQQVHDARTDPVSGEKARQRWHQIRAGIRHVTTPTGLTLPRLALPQTDDPGEIARYLHGEGLPGEFPYVNSAYPELYVIPATAAAPDGAGSGSRPPPPAALEAPKKTEEPTRLFAGLGLAEDTNQRFRFLTRQQKSIRLSTAFDGPTLYGLDSDADGVFGKIGEGGVA